MPKNSILLMTLVAACGGAAHQVPDDKPLISEAGDEPRPLGDAPDAAPPPAKRAPTPAKVVRPGLVGEMCLDKGAGRAALSLLIERQVGWSADPRELEHLAGHQAARPFTVLSARGKRAGTFGAVGPVDLGTESPALTGGYAGSPPCEDKDAAFAAACSEAQGKCGLAVASLAVDGETDAPRLATGAACVDKDRLYVDLDGDGVDETYKVAGFLDELKAPAQEVAPDGPPGKTTCTRAFSLPRLERGNDAKAFRSMDLLGIVDLDDDGHLELVMQYRYASVRTWAIYALDGERLTLVGEVTPWSPE
jgi:hypothetical protein